MMTLSMKLTVRVATLSCATLLAGCGSLLPKAAPPPAYYTLQGLPAKARTAPAQAPVLTQHARSEASALLARTTLLVLPPKAAAGYDSARILYTRTPNQLEYFAHSEWVDTPARMLTPLLVAALAESQRFAAVVQAPSGARNGWRLETQLLRMQHDFSTTPSRMQVALRAQLLDSATQTVLATRLFESSVASASENPAGGVAAAQRAVQAMLDELVGFCVEATATDRADFADPRLR